MEYMSRYVFGSGKEKSKKPVKLAQATRQNGEGGRKLGTRLLHSFAADSATLSVTTKFDDESASFSAIHKDTSEEEASAIRVQAAARGVLAQRRAQSKRDEAVPRLPATKAFASRGPIPPLDARVGSIYRKLSVQVLKGVNLLTSDGNAYLGTASSDPMVFLEIEGILARTSVQRQTTNPTWPAVEANFVFNLHHIQRTEAVLRLVVYDWDADGNHDPLGHAATPLVFDSPGSDGEDATLSPGLAITHTLDLKGMGKNGRLATGSITVKLKFEPSFVTSPVLLRWPTTEMPGAISPRSANTARTKEALNVKGLALVASRLSAVGARNLSAWALEDNSYARTAALDRELDCLFEKQVLLIDGDVDDHRHALQNALARRELRLAHKSFEATIAAIYGLSHHCRNCLVSLALAAPHFGPVTRAAQVAMSQGMPSNHLTFLLTECMNAHLVRCVRELVQWLHEDLASIGVPDSSSLNTGARRGYPTMSLALAASVAAITTATSATPASTSSGHDSGDRDPKLENPLVDLSQSYVSERAAHERPLGKVHDTPLGKVLPAMLDFLARSGDLFPPSQQDATTCALDASNIPQLSSCGMFGSAIASALEPELQTGTLRIEKCKNKNFSSFEHSFSFGDARFSSTLPDFTDRFSLCGKLGIGQRLCDLVHERGGSNGSLPQLFARITQPFSLKVDHVAATSKSTSTWFHASTSHESSAAASSTPISGGGCLHAVLNEWHSLLVPPSHTNMAWPTDALALLETHVRSSASAATSAAAAGADAAVAATVSGDAASPNSNAAAAEVTGLLLAVSLRIGAHALDAFLHTLLGRFAELRSMERREHCRVLQTHAVKAAQNDKDHLVSAPRAARFRSLANAADRCPCVQISSRSNGSSMDRSGVQLTLERSFWSLPASLHALAASSKRSSVTSRLSSHRHDAHWGDEDAASAVVSKEVHAAVDVLCAWIKDANRCREGIHRIFAKERWPQVIKTSAQRGPCAGLSTLLQAEASVAKRSKKAISTTADIVGPGVFPVAATSYQADHELLELQNQLDESLDDLVASAAHQLALVILQGLRFGGGSGAGALLNLFPEAEPGAGSTTPQRVSSADACSDVASVLGYTLPVLEKRLNGASEPDNSNNSSGFDGDNALAQVKTHVSEAVVFGLIALVARSASATDNLPSEPAKVPLVPSFSAFAHAVTELRDNLLAEGGSSTADPNAGVLGEGPWQSRFDWLVAVANFLCAHHLRGDDDYDGNTAAGSTRSIDGGSNKNLVEAHFKLCDTFSLDPKGPMLDFAVYLALEVRRDYTLSELAERFGPLLLADPVAAEKRRLAASDASEVSRTSAKTSSRKSAINATANSSGSNGNVGNNTDWNDEREDAAVAVAACGIPGMVTALTESLEAARAVGRVLSAAEELLDVAPLPSPSLSLEEHHNHDARYSVEVQVVSGANLTNLTQASMGFTTSMISPLVRVSLERRYGHGPQPFKNYARSAGRQTNNNGSDNNNGHGRSWFETAVSRKNVNPQWRNQALADAAEEARIKKLETEVSASDRNGLSNDDKHHHDVAAAYLAQFSGTLEVGDVGSFWGTRLRCEAFDGGSSDWRSLGVAYIDLFEWDPTSCDRRERAAWFPLVPSSSNGLGGGALFLRLRRHDRHEDPVAIGSGRSIAQMPPSTTGPSLPSNSTTNATAMNNGAGELRRPSLEPKEQKNALVQSGGGATVAEHPSKSGGNAVGIPGKAGASDTGAAATEETLDAELAAARLALSNAQNEARTAAHAASEKKRSVQELEAKVKQSKGTHRVLETTAQQACCSPS